jgi:predicted MFS family arabinose efflux permease
MTETSAQGFGRAGSIEIIILFAAFIAATYGFGMYLFASLIPEMRSEIGFDYAAVGLMTAAAQGGFLIFALVSGLFASVIGARKAIIFSMFLCAACLILMPFADNSLIVAVLLALMAAAAASVWIPMVAVCKELIPAKHQGKAFGLISSGTAYGVFINGLAVPLLMPSYGWKSIWLVLGAGTLGFALWAMLRIGLRDQPAQSGTPAKLLPLGSRLRVLGRPEALAILLMMFLNGLSCMPAQNYLSAMMREELGYSVGSAALAWSIIGFVGMFSGLAIGALADRISIRWAMVVTYVLLCISAAFFLNHASLTVIYAGAVAFGLAFYAIFGLVPAYTSIIFSKEEATSVFGIGNVLLGLGGMVGNYFAGLAREYTGSFETTYWIVLVAAVATLVLSLVMRNERKPGKSRVV